MNFCYLAHVCSHSINMYAQLSSGVRGLNFIKCPYFMFASSEGSGKGQGL